MTPDNGGVILPLHLGNLHPFEQAMVVLLAFGPLLLLVATVVVARRRDAGREREPEEWEGD